MPDTKISALAAAIVLDGSEAIPFAKAGANGRASIALLQAPAVQAGKAARRGFVKIGHDGDSKGLEAQAAALWLAAKYGLDAWVGAFALNKGGTNTGTGTASGNDNLTNPTRLSLMATTVSAQVSAGWTVDMTLTIGTNDIVLAGLAAETIMANVRKYHNSFRDAGGRYLIIFAIDPRGTSASPLSAAQARALQSYNQAVEHYCRIVSDAFYVDCSPWTVDPASSNASFWPLGQASGAAFSVAADALHFSGYGTYLKQFALEPLMRFLYRARVKAPPIAASAYNASDGARGNVLGAQGRTQTIGGTNSSTGGTVTGTPPAGWTLSGDLKGLTLDFAVVNSGLLTAAFGLANYPAVRMTWSGTPTANAEITLSRNVVLAAQGAQWFRGEALVGFNAFVGSFGLQLRSVNTGPTAYVNLGSTAYYPSLGAFDQLPQLDGLYNVPLFTIPTTNGNSGLALDFHAGNGVTTSGSVDLIGAHWGALLDPPAAS